MLKRTQYIVDRTFQQRVAMDLMVIVLLVPVVLWANFYIVGMYALTQNPEIANLPRDWGLVGLLLKQQWWLIFLFITVSFGLSFGFIFYYTHRIAGPVYRFRLLFDMLAEGKVGVQVKLRKGDCFENLAESVSRASAALAGSITELKSVAATLTQKVDALGDRDLEKQVAAINQVLDRYNVAPESTKP